MNEYLIALSALFIFGSGLTVIISCAQVDRLEKRLEQIKKEIKDMKNERKDAE